MWKGGIPIMSEVISFTVEVLSGELMPVLGLEVGARYRYPEAPRSWSSETTDGEGLATFRDSHMELPTEICLFVEGEECGSFAANDGAHFVLEM